MRASSSPSPTGSRSIRAPGRLDGKVALITGADSGIGRAVAALFAREGADIAILYLCEHDDAARTKQIVEARGPQGDHHRRRPRRQGFLRQGGRRRWSTKLGGIDILVNNAGEQHPDKDITDITEEQLKRTFQTNIFSMFFLTQAARPHLKKGAAIVNCTSVTSYQGSEELLDYSATKGAITAFTRSLSENLVGDGIRVNAVAPGPIWTPLNPCGGASAREDQEVRQEHADGPARPAQRGRAQLPVPRLRGFAATCRARSSTPMAGRSSAARPFAAGRI